MRNVRVLTITAVSLIALALAGCSREREDWRSTQAADTAEAYQQFLQQHPNSSHDAEAQARVKQLLEDRDWKVAAAADTRDAYEQFLSQHPDSKWAQEARIRIENFAQSAQAKTPAAGETAPTVTPSTAAPKAAPAPAAPLSAAPGGEHAVQLGAYRSEASAMAAWKKLQGKYAELKSLQPRYVRSRSHAKTVYRLQAVVASSARAKELCGKLKRHAQPCVVAK
jgi:hypothetical protein